MPDHRTAANVRRAMFALTTRGNPAYRDTLSDLADRIHAARRPLRDSVTEAVKARQRMMRDTPTKEDP